MPVKNIYIFDWPVEMLSTVVLYISSSFKKSLTVRNQTNPPTVEPMEKSMRNFMRNTILAIVVSVLALNLVTEVKLAEAKGLKLKRKPRGVPNSTAQGSKKVEKPAEVKTEAAPEAQTEVKNSGLSLKEGPLVSDIRARQKAKRERDAKAAKLFSDTDVAYQPRFIAGCGQYGVKSEAESATRHYACETGFKLDVKIKEWPVGVYFLGTLQSSPYKEGFVYKNEINYGNTRQIYGDLSVGISHDWDYWRTTGELGVGLEKSGISNFKGIYRARIITNPHDNLLAEFAILTLIGPRTEATLTVLTNKLSDPFFIGLGAGTRSYNDVIRHDRGFVEARYKFEDWAIVGNAEYALGGFGAGGGMKIEIPKFW